MELWLPGCPADPLPFLGSEFRPSALVLHRTIGHWGGDYSTLSRARVPSVPWLIGEEPGQWVQWYPFNRTCAHAAGANGYAVGVEISGQNDTDLTPWQIECLGKIIAFCRRNGVGPGYLEPDAPRVAGFNGVLHHSNVATTPQYTHYDFVRTKDYLAAVGDGGAAERERKAAEQRLSDIRRKKTMLLVQSDGFYILTGDVLLECPDGIDFNTMIATGVPFVKVSTKTTDYWKARLKELKGTVVAGNITASIDSKSVAEGVTAGIKAL